MSRTTIDSLNNNARIQMYGSTSEISLRVVLIYEAGHALIYGDVGLLGDKSRLGAHTFNSGDGMHARTSDIGQYKFWGPPERASDRLILSHPRAVSFDKGDTQYDTVAGALYDIFTHIHSGAMCILYQARTWAILTG
jgi:hypothetical protein